MRKQQVWYIMEYYIILRNFLVKTGIPLSLFLIFHVGQATYFTALF